jgi:hypothetical protein
MKAIILLLGLLMTPCFTMAQDAVKVKKIPDPVAQFAGKSDGTIAKSIAMSTRALTAEMMNFEYDIIYKVESFKFIYFKNGFVAEIPGIGNKLTDKMISVISSLSSGSKFGFESIRATGPDGKIKILNSIILKIE